MRFRLSGRFAAALLAAAAPALSAAAAPPRTLRVANYNVENLFDAVVNQPTNALTGAEGDADWCASSWRHWTESRYRTKLARIAWVIAKMQPDVIALEEVENRGVVEALAATLETEHGWGMPYIAHKDTDDPRGIDIAVLSRHPIVSQRYFGHRGRRGLLVATVDAGGAPITVFASHWKSQLGDAESNLYTRSREAQELRREMAKLLDDDPAASFVSLGDFNEDMDGPASSRTLRAATARSVALASLDRPVDDFRPYNLVADIPAKKRGSFFYARHRKWNTYDGILVAPAMLLPAGEPGPAWRAGKPSETQTFALPEMRWHDGRPFAYRRARVYEDGSGGDDVSDESSYGGYSDHFPVLSVLHFSGDPAAAAGPED